MERQVNELKKRAENTEAKIDLLTNQVVIIKERSNMPLDVTIYCMYFRYLYIWDLPPSREIFVDIRWYM